MRKTKRYDEGGVTEGRNSNIDDDTRARAMKFVREQAEKSSEDESSGEKTVSRSTKAKVSSKPAESKARGATSNPATRSDPDAPEATTETPRMRTREEVKAAIPTGGKAGAGPTESKGNSASGSELGRNVRNTMSALAPLGGGVGKIGAELAMSGRAAKAAEAAAEAKKVSDAAAKATRAARMAKVAPRAEREAKTLNPNAYLAGPKGMRENFKSGGMTSSASKRADGIASKGKTRGKVC
jgi:hypothetical protein